MCIVFGAHGSRCSKGVVQRASRTWRKEITFYINQVRPRWILMWYAPVTFDKKKRGNWRHNKFNKIYIKYPKRSQWPTNSSSSRFQDNCRRRRRNLRIAGVSILCFFVFLVPLIFFFLRIKGVLDSLLLVHCRRRSWEGLEQVALAWD